MAINSWDALIVQIVKWQREAHPDVSASSNARCLLAKTGELMHDPFDLDMWVDVLFIVLEGSDRLPHTNFPDTVDTPADELLLAVRKKFEQKRLIL